MGLTQSVVLLAAGFVAGVMNSVAGGGTLVTFPTLVFAGLPPIVANATSTVAILPGTAGSLAGYRKNLSAVSRWLKLFSPVCLVGGLLGGILLVQTPSDLFDALVPFLILFATVLFTANTSVNRFLKARAASPSHLQSRPWLIGALLFQFGVAVYGGYFGAGIGILMLASLGMLGFRDVHQMNTIKVVLGFLINVVAAVYFIWNGLIDWQAAGIMALGTIGGGYAGAHFAQKVPQSAVRASITAIGLIITAVMFYKQLGHQ
jgi:uncharacterized membrane protein YfcA